MFILIHYIEVNSDLRSEGPISLNAVSHASVLQDVSGHFSAFLDSDYKESWCISLHVVGPEMTIKEKKNL